MATATPWFNRLIAEMLKSQSQNENLFSSRIENPNIAELSYSLDMLLTIQAKEQEMCRNILNDFISPARQYYDIGLPLLIFNREDTNNYLSHIPCNPTPRGVQSQTTKAILHASNEMQSTFNTRAAPASLCTGDNELCLKVKQEEANLFDCCYRNDSKLSSDENSPAASSSSSSSCSVFYDEEEKGKRPHACKECGKRFRFKSNLFEHKSLHQKTFPFSCPFCGKTCRLKGNLKKHLQIHVGTVEELEKLWKCSFSRSSGRPRKNAALMPLPAFGDQLEPLYTSVSGEIDFK